MRNTSSDMWRQSSVHTIFMAVTGLRYNVTLLSVFHHTETGRKTIKLVQAPPPDPATEDRGYCWGYTTSAIAVAVDFRL